ncbi:threonine aldolase [Alkalihalobacillus alcalophilus ATCC 27647 = CGMCC 1.3604]|uniref:Threonine aldolase n=1 Tax=Alkalihalobacillus alcalophilus ATCC 27647 = CGMCC 1.3604 TaxID=1218173 RepID=A0A094WM00_ALKAL|nr:low-specificity L-threonine aldolase [Alkalihalobacillus alcalophilus]KGA96988.1 threonine aldolase [Alkalihalobacillus alcalophilus ATCC 27647 = CGMCC 1.3604]MED1564210.1 low-specificity L-threonine aldolase [Alkalihalobacillus alcalophilus]THG90279.1 threonine aldolase [Alkalihalobacillus alcalophilus ATCC 27647 = CGMCC 1.3604]
MIDLRSDTVTKPDEKMRKAMYEAEVGDDVYQEDPTVKELEERAADLLGKEAALFVTSGTQGNQIAGLVHCKPGEEVILEAQSHIFLYEGAAMSAFAGVQLQTLTGERGALNIEDVRNEIRSDDIHEPKTSLICLENTHNKAGGAIIPLENMKEIYTLAESNRINVHLDGARLFNASVASGIPVKDFAHYTDTVQFCLSKGLGAPVGSIIAGSLDFIAEARRWRKRLGGGLRQVGVLAAPSLIALNENVERLQIDHEHAQLLAEGLQNIEGISLENKVDTNIVLISLKSNNIPAFLEKLKGKGIRAGQFGANKIRFVTHKDISSEDINTALLKIQQVVLDR